MKKSRERSILFSVLYLGAYALGKGVREVSILRNILNILGR